jgi:hypothetical protein
MGITPYKEKYMPLQKYNQYLDEESGVIKQPDPWGDPFGDGVWRSAWFYSSLIILRSLNTPLYNTITTTNGINAEGAGSFLNFFSQNCLSENGWALPKNPSQKFSRDQLVPLLYLLGVVNKFAPEFVDVGKNILHNLIVLEKNDTGLSNTQKGSIGRNIGYMIDVLCDNARYNLNYRSSDLTFYLVPCLGNIKCAKGNRRGVYKNMFSLALNAHELGGWIRPSGIDVTDEYSVFNALAAVSLQCVAWGKDDSDVKDWRDNLKLHADDGWGPAFQIVAGRSISDADITAWADAHVTRALDNDIISAQRPVKIRDGILTSDLKGGVDHWLTLDYVILKALRVLWG